MMYKITLLLLLITGCASSPSDNVTDLNLGAAEIDPKVLYARAICTQSESLVEKLSGWLKEDAQQRRLSQNTTLIDDASDWVNSIYPSAVQSNTPDIGPTDAKTFNQILSTLKPNNTFLTSPANANVAANFSILSVSESATGDHAQLYLHFPVLDDFYIAIPFSTVVSDGSVHFSKAQAQIFLTKDALPISCEDFVSAERPVTTLCSPPETADVENLTGKTSYANDAVAIYPEFKSVFLWQLDRLTNNQPWNVNATFTLNDDVTKIRPNDIDFYFEWMCTSGPTYRHATVTCANTEATVENPQGGSLIRCQASAGGGAFEIEASIDCATDSPFAPIVVGASGDLRMYIHTAASAIGCGTGTLSASVTPKKM